MLRHALADAGLDGPEDEDLTEASVLLTSELCENATLHAGTEFEVAVGVTADEVVVSVTDRGAGPLEQYLARPRPRFGRAASHGRGLMLVERLATAWGTRHHRDGTHRTWFSLARGAAAPRDGAVRPDTPAPLSVGAPGFGQVAAVAPERAPNWPATEQVRRLLHVPAALGVRLDMPALVAELARRLREILDADGVVVQVDHGDGHGAFTLAQDGADPTALPDIPLVELGLPLAAPLRGSLRILASDDRSLANTEIADLAAQRIALAVEMDWLRGADLRRRAWMTYLADASELFSQSMDTKLVVALVPQVVVPRLGEWSAVYLLHGGQRVLSALTHADDDAIPDLRAELTPSPPAGLDRHLADILHGAAAPGWFSEPTDGIVVGLTARGQPIGALVVGRPTRRSHTPEDVALVADIARRASLAIDNAQTTSAHIATSQALQQALLPRALPAAPGIEFAAEYLPASAGTDVGGDFYDVLTIDENRWLASIGDVCGKGARAAARTSMVRDVLRVLIRTGRTLTEAIEQLNDVMLDTGDPYQFCTLAAALISRPLPGESPGLVVDLVLAGHPQPVLVHADGRTELIGRYGTAVGLLPQVQLVTTRYRLHTGETLLAYTDGVTERRGGRRQFGSERLLAAASTAGGRPAAQVIAAVQAAVAGFSSAPQSDDIALFAIRATR
jgi:serine phosphatase RsbU (regulator of sigma subunit)/anti-sigma regulatory factor (Ser/Thr protein kinase)